jgi:hypothetical protein
MIVFIYKWRKNDRFVAERGEFSWEKLFYVTDAISFYAGVLMMVRKTPLFAMPFISKMYHFTKTGSGQT